MNLNFNWLSSWLDVIIRYGISVDSLVGGYFLSRLLRVGVALIWNWREKSIGYANAHAFQYFLLFIVVSISFIQTVWLFTFGGVVYVSFGRVSNADSQMVKSRIRGMSFGTTLFFAMLFENCVWSLLSLQAEHMIHENNVNHISFEMWIFMKKIKIPIKCCKIMFISQRE